MFALEAALSTVPLGRIAVYDVPYDTGPDAGPRYDHYRSELAAALAADRRGDAVALFMTLAGVPADEVDQARGSTAWPAVERLAHTLAYDAELYGPPPLDRLTAITCPTLVLTSGAATFYETAADAVADAIPGALRMRLPDQGHVADPDVSWPPPCGRSSARSEKGDGPAGRRGVKRPRACAAVRGSAATAA